MISTERNLLVALLAIPLLGCVTETVVPNTPDRIFYHTGTYSYAGDGFYDVETRMELEKDDKRRVAMSSKCSLWALERSWNCESVRDPDHPIAKKTGCSEEMPHRCMVSITINRRGELVPFFPELERQCVLEMGVVRKNPQYDSAYANAESEYRANPRVGNTIVCEDERHARREALFDLIETISN